MNLRLLGVFALGALLAACSDETSPKLRKLFTKTRGLVTLKDLLRTLKQGKKRSSFL